MISSQLLVLPGMVIAVNILIFLALYIRTGFGMKQTVICGPSCVGSDSITVNQERVDFQTAEQVCHDRNGELLTLQSDTNEKINDILSQGLSGNFWIGLRLPSGMCSNLSAPLRGYEWTSHKDRSIIPSFNTWADSITLCSPHCVSLSNNGKWSERLCSDIIDGFLCKTRHNNAYQAQKLSDPVIFKNPKGCSTGPCEHICKDVKGGYMCSCFSGYIPKSKDPTQCKLHCAQEKCPAMCDKNTDSSCECPDGFLLNEKFCEDINECEMGECDQECKNTFGGFVCSCSEGFVLKNQGKCVRAGNSESLVIPTPIVEGFVKTSANNNTLKGSSATVGDFFWIWIVIAVVIVVFIFVFRFHVVKRQRLREQSPNQQPTAAAPVDNIEC